MPYTLQNIIDWYQAVQFRDGNPATTGSYLHLLNASALTQDQVLQAILDEQYTKDFVNPVIRLYQAAFDRIPDQSGQNFWVDNLAAGLLTSQDLANDFANSQEFKELYGVGGASDPVSASFLTALYQNVLQRAPDVAGYQFWLNSGVSVGQALNYFANSAEFITSTDAAIDLYQVSQLSHTLPEESVSLWHFVLPEPVIPQPEPEPDPGPDPITFTVTNSSGSLAFGGTAIGDVTFTVASDGTASFTRGGVTASTTYAVNTIAASPLIIKLSADIGSIALADAFAMVNIYNYDANGHLYTLSDTVGSLGAMTVAEADVVENATNAASYTYTIADYISNADGLNFTTAYAHNLGINLTGSAGDQAVSGSSYADSIEGGIGIDTLIGGGGNDSLDGGGDANQLTGGIGADTFVISNNNVSDTISDLALNNEADVIINGANSRVIAFAQGNWVATSSTINSNSSGPSAFAIYADNAESIDLSSVSNLSAGGYQVLSSGTGAVVGSLYNDYLYFEGVGSASFTGGAGSDVFDANSSNANSQLTITDLGLGGDGIYYRSGALGDITATVTADWVGNASTNKGSGIISLTSGSAGVDINVSAADSTNGWSISGSTGAEILVGDDHNDTIRGEAGNDTITGGAGVDDIWVGSGVDTVVFNAVAGTSSDSNVGVGWDILRDIKLSDFIRINASNVNQFSVTSNVTAYGTDYYADINVDGYTAGDVYIRIYGDMFTSFSSDYVAMQANAIAHTIVDLAGTNLDDTLGGGANADTLTGGLGADVLTGGAGVDVLDGGAGANRYIYNSNAEFVSSGAVVDFVTGGSDTDTIQINAAIQLTTSDTLATRLVSVEQLVAETQSADSRAHSIVLDTSDKLGTVTTIDLSGDTNATSTGAITMIGVSTGLTLIGVNGGGSNTISGGAGNDSITGGIGADTLRGGGGNDTIFGGDGNDSIVGNAGADSLTGGGGNDVFTYSNVADWSSSEVITDFANSSLNATSISNGALSSINGDIFLFDLSNLAAITGYVALGTTVTSGVSTLAAGDWASGAANQAHAQFVLVGTDTLAFDPDGTGATAAITVVGHYTYTWLTGTMIALTA